MNVLVVGQGGREHALVKALRQSATIAAVHALPGSDGMRVEATVHAVPTSDMFSVLDVINKNQIRLVVIGPEVELANGLADFLRENGVSVFGPSRAAAQLEASKIFAKSFMVEAGIPTARAVEVNTVEATLRCAADFTPPYVLKADGLAAGKGVILCSDLEELRQAATDFFEKRILGEAGQRALLEQFQPGWELSYLILTNGQHFEALPLSQDHKRLQDGGKGPNTGGMGTVAPIALTPELEQQIHSQILWPSVRALQKKNLFYRGVLYVGLMITPTGPTVIEYNCRFGDPETQVVLPLLEGDWGAVFFDVAEGRVPPLQWKREFCACVVLAAEGYPVQAVKGAVIDGDMTGSSPHSYFLHAGTKQSDGQWVTNGGRVLNAIGTGPTLKDALGKAYQQAGLVRWRGMQMRQDIGQGLNRPEITNI